MLLQTSIFEALARDFIGVLLQIAGVKVKGVSSANKDIHVHPAESKLFEKDNKFQEEDKS